MVVVVSPSLASCPDSCAICIYLLWHGQETTSALRVRPAAATCWWCLLVCPSLAPRPGLPGEHWTVHPSPLCSAVHLLPVRHDAMQSILERRHYRVGQLLLVAGHGYWFVSGTLAWSARWTVHPWPLCSAVHLLPAGHTRMDQVPIRIAGASVKKKQGRKYNITFRKQLQMLKSDTVVSHNYPG